MIDGCHLADVPATGSAEYLWRCQIPRVGDAVPGSGAVECGGPLAGLQFAKPRQSSSDQFMAQAVELVALVGR